MRIEVRLTGFGGQGIIRAGRILGEAAVKQGYDAAMRPTYGPEKTGGWSRSDVIISDKPIVFPLTTQPDILVAMSQEGIDRDGWSLRDGGTALVDGDLVKKVSAPAGKLYSVKATEIADRLGKRIVANIVMLGALSKILDLIDSNILLEVIVKTFPKAADLNKKAFSLGQENLREVEKQLV